MLQSLFKKVFGSRNDRLVKQYLQKVKAINALEPAMEKLSDAELAGKTAEFKTRLENGETLDKLLVAGRLNRLGAVYHGSPAGEIYPF
jgi:preprotein translocase subunit SecA